MKVASRASAVAVGVSLWTMFAAAPALAAGLPAGASSGSICDPLSASWLSTGAGGGVSARGDGAREPSLDQTHEEMPDSARGRAGKHFKVTVPVWFHVITSGPAGDLTQSQIDAQIAVLNNNFAGREGGADTGFRFALEGVTRTDNLAWFEMAGAKHERAMKNALHRGGPETLNLYSNTASDYLGWAYFPDIVDKPGRAFFDGVVFDWESIPGVSDAYAGQYDLGKTATHEVGHWLDLEHTFYRGCHSTGDYVDDTPAEATPTRGCPAGKDTCPAPGDDPIHNYMDYSYDACYSQFTNGQAQRMRDAWLYYRA